jgi:hypothetical protein
MRHRLESFAPPRFLVAPHLVVLALSLSGCGPTVQAAGHTVNPEGKTGNVAPEKSLSGERTPSSTAKRPRAGDTASSPPLPPLPEPEELYAEVPHGGRLIGTAGPIALEAWGRGGHWVAHCSLNEGTKFGPRGEAKEKPDLSLTLGDRAEPIEAVLASDEGGRYLVALISEKAWLIDAVQEKRLDLTALTPDLRFDALPSHRSFAFTQTGLALLSGTEGTKGYFLPLSEKTDLEAPILSWAHPIEFGARPVWRLFGHGLSFSGATIPEGSTEKSWPVSPSQTPTLRCQAPTSEFHAFERASAYRPDRSLTHVFSLTPEAPEKVKTIQPTEAPGFVFGFRDGWVRREDSGRLLLVRGKTQEQISSEKCGARILHADEKSGLFLIACEEYTPLAPPVAPGARKTPKYRFDLYLIRPGFVRSLKVDTARTGVDYHGSGDQRLLALRPGATAALVDFKKRVLLPLEGELQVVLTSASAAVLRRGNRLHLWTPKGEEPIDLKVATLDPVLTTRETAAIGKTMLALGDTLRTWELPAAPLAITDHGYALVPKRAPELGSWPTGPLLLLAPPESSALPASPSSSQ